MAEVSQRLSNAKETTGRNVSLQSHEDLARKLQEEMERNRKSSSGLREGSGRRMKEVACPTCTVHLQVQVPVSGSETIECGVCQNPFLVSAHWSSYPLFCLTYISIISMRFGSFGYWIGFDHIKISSCPVSCGWCFPFVCIWKSFEWWTSYTFHVVCCPTDVWLVNLLYQSSNVITPASISLTTHM